MAVQCLTSSRTIDWSFKNNILQFHALVLTSIILEVKQYLLFETVFSLFSYAPRPGHSQFWNQYLCLQI